MIACVLVMSACSLQNEHMTSSLDDQVTTGESLESAKSAVFADQQRILSHLPDDMIIDSEIGQEATLLSCGDGYVWPGAARVELRPGIDLAAVTAAIIADFESEPDWVVTSLGDDGHFRTEVRHRDDARGHFFGFDKVDGTVFQISSFSPCFDLGFEPRIGQQY